MIFDMPSCFDARTSAININSNQTIFLNPSHITRHFEKSMRGRILTASRPRSTITLLVVLLYKQKKKKNAYCKWNQKNTLFTLFTLFKILSIVNYVFLSSSRENLNFVPKEYYDFLRLVLWAYPREPKRRLKNHIYAGHGLKRGLIERKNV